MNIADASKSGCTNWFDRKLSKGNNANVVRSIIADP